MHAVTFLANGLLYVQCLVWISVVWDWSQHCQLKYFGPEGPGGTRNTNIPLISQLQTHTQATGRLPISVSITNFNFFLAKTESFSMELSSQIVILGDKPNSFNTDLRQLLYIKANFVLRSFFDRAQGSCFHQSG